MITFEDDTRRFMLKRVDEIRKVERNFEDDKWIDFSHGALKQHARDVQWESLNEYELVVLFERLVRRYYL